MKSVKFAIEGREISVKTFLIYLSRRLEFVSSHCVIDLQQRLEHLKVRNVKLEMAGHMFLERC